MAQKQRLKCDDLIVGAGMQGIMATRACVSQGRDCIVVEKGPGVGGILQPVVLNGIPVDSGCHIWGAREHVNIEFIETEVGIEMIPVHGHCEISASTDGVLRRRLAVPSFESLPEEWRIEAIGHARAMDPGILASEPIGVSMPRAFGRRVSDEILAMARRLYGRDPGDLTIDAAAQMALCRMKLHTCDELRARSTDAPDLGPLLCSHPLDGKDDSLVKYRYPQGGLHRFVDGCLSWMEANTRDLALSASPRSLEATPGRAGGTLELKDRTIDYQRLLWCCNPLALGTLVDLPLPEKQATAGSPFRLFVFVIQDDHCQVEYSHDFRLDSPMFRSWIPPVEMAVGEPGSRYVIVECPGAGNDPGTIASVGRHAAAFHGLDHEALDYLGTRAQVRFFPTMAYVNWLKELSRAVDVYEQSIVVPDKPLYGKDVITEWWTRAIGAL